MKLGSFFIKYEMAWSNCVSVNGWTAVLKSSCCCCCAVGCCCSWADFFRDFGLPASLPFCCVFFLFVSLHSFLPAFRFGFDGPVRWFGGSMTVVSNIVGGINLAGFPGVVLFVAFEPTLLVFDGATAGIGFFNNACNFGSLCWRCDSISLISAGCALFKWAKLFDAMKLANGDVPKSIVDVCCCPCCCFCCCCGCCCWCVGELIRIKLKPFSTLPAAALA